MMQTINVLAPFPLYEDYGSSIRVITELKLIENAIKYGYIKPLKVRLITYDISSGYLTYLNKITDVVRIYPSLARAYRMGFNVSRVSLDILLIGKLLEKLKDIIGSREYLHIHTTIPLGYLYPLTKILRINNIITDLHGIISYEVPTHLSHLFSVIESDILEKSRTLLFSNLSTKYCYEHIMKNKKINHLTYILPEAIDTNIFRPLDEKYINELRRKMKIDNKIVILYTGSFTEVQGVDKLIYAYHYVAKELPNSILLLVGGRWTPSTYEIYKKIAKRHSNKILIFRSVNYLTGLNKLVNIADITVSPKLPTCQSNQKIQVYASVGKPVVVFKTIANYFLLREHAIYAEELNPLSLAKAILKAYELLSSGKFKNEELVSFIRENYSINSPKLLKIIQDIYNV